MSPPRAAASSSSNCGASTPCPYLEQLSDMVRDVHRAVVGDEKYGHRGLVSRMEESERKIETTGTELAKFKNCVQKEQWGQRGFVGGISLAVTLIWNAVMAWLSHGGSK